VDIDPTDAVVLEAWSLLRAAADIDEILDAVLQRGLRAVRSFALVRVSGDDRLVVVRGAADAIITVDGQESHVTAAGVATWREYPLPANASAVQLRASAIAGGVDEAPLSAGVTLAATIRVAVTDVSQTARLGPANTPSRPAQSQAPTVPPNGPTSAPARPPAPAPQPPVLASGPSLSDEQVGPPTVPIHSCPPRRLRTSQGPTPWRGSPPSARSGRRLRTASRIGRHRAVSPGRTPLPWPSRRRGHPHPRTPRTRP
jgi:hypothetical protein